MVGVENAENTIRALSYAKAKFGLNPQLVVSDFSPNMIKGIITVWDESVLQIDGFHVMQELNNGIRVDLAQYRDLLYRNQIKELFWLRENITMLQRKQKDATVFSSEDFQPLKQFQSQFSFSQISIELTKDNLSLLTVSSPKRGERILHSILTKWQARSEPAIVKYIQKLTKFLPKRALTEGGLERVKKKCLQLLKSIYSTFRQQLEEGSLEFFRAQWVLFFQPEELNDARKLLLTDFLTKYPQLQEYRNITLQVGSIYRKTCEKIDGTEITSLTIKASYSEKLQTAIRTFQKYNDAILRFVRVFQQDPTLRKGCRANMEPYNRRFKAPFRRGLNCTKKTHLINKLELQLKCEVRWLIEDPVVI